MRSFNLTIILVLLAVQGSKAKVSTCLSCASQDSDSECAKGTLAGGTFYNAPCFQAQPVA